MKNYGRYSLILIAVCWVAAMSTARGATPADIRTENMESTVYIEIHGSGKNGVPYDIEATGFVVSATGELITANHIFTGPAGEPINPVAIKGAARSRYDPLRDIEILDTAPNLDLALLRFKGNKTDYRPVKVCPDRQPKIGDRLVGLGFPKGSELSEIDGILSNQSAEKGWYQTNVDFIQGYSGGPVFEMQSGSAVGIVMGGTPDVAGRNFYLPINRASNLLSQLATKPACLSSPSAAITISDGNLNYSQSGFSFARRVLVAWNSPDADILAATTSPRRDGEALFFMPYDEPPYNAAQDKLAKSGIRQIDASQYDDQTQCPSDGYTYHWKSVRPSQTFCVRSRTADSYYKLLVKSVARDYISFEWK
jgi:hypothetical protein